MIDITENAIKRIKDISTKQESNLFRISVDGGGCQGFSYKFSFDKIKRSDDLEIKFDEITVLIDKTSMDFLDGSKLDFIGSYFKVSNPKASSTCGCGTSFSI
jgi:iron-sulfur cluster assembly accessory protein